MASAHLDPSRTLVVLLSASLVAACAKDEPKKAAPTTATTAGVVTPPPSTDATPVVPTTTPTKISLASGGTIHALSNDEAVLGHFLIASTSNLLRDVKTQIAPPRAASMLDESALRGIVAMGLGQRSSMAQAFDLAAPVGCALLEVQPEPQLGCTFGYRGGSKQFVTDLGEQNKLQDALGHAAAYGVEGNTVFVDDLGAQVVVSSGADTFKRTSAYLQRNLIDRANDVHGDIEVVGYVATAFDRYRDKITPFIEQFSGSATPPAATGNPAIDGAIQAFSAYQKRSSKQTFERIAEVAQLTMFFSVEPAGFMAGGATFPKPGSRMALEAGQLGGIKLDPAFVGIAPTGTAMLAAFHNNPRVYELPSVVDARKMIAEAWAPLSGRDAVSIEAALTAFQAEQASMYDGNNTFALGNEPGAPVAVFFASHLISGKAARDAWKAWSASFTPEAVLGANISQYLTWKFTPDAATIDGVVIDRWTIEPGATLKKQAETSMPADAKVMLDKVLGGMFIHIDRAEVGGHVIHTLAPKAEANYMKRAIAAVQGTGNVGAQPGIAKIVGRDPEALGVMAVDVKQMLDLARNAAANYGGNSNDVPKYGTDLSDFFVTFRYATDGTSAMEFVLSQAMIEQFKPLMQ